MISFEYKCTNVCWRLGRIMMDNILFLVASPYQLFNAIVIRMSVLQECRCDILLRSAISWNEDMLKRLEEEKVFGRLYRPDFTEVESSFWGLSDEEKMELVENPDLYYGEEPIEFIYDKIFAALDSAAWKILYHQCVLKGKKPDVIQYDEGLRSYSMDFKKSDNRPFFMGEYGKNNFCNAINGMYLYRPEVYSVDEYDYELYKLPNPYENTILKEKLTYIFGNEPMPEERFIYFEDFFFTDRHVTNDMELFKEIARIVGKDNIVVKTHPRDDYDRFAPMGYKTIGKSNTPWECQLLNSTVEKKILISVTSTAILTPYIIFNKNINVVSLEKLYKWEVPLHTDEGFQKCLDRIKKNMNENGVYLHMPSSLEELRELLLYMKSN